MNNTKTTVLQPHDLLVRNILGDPELVADVMRNYLPSDVVSHLDLKSLHREAVESIDPKLAELLGDLRFSGKFKGTGLDLNVAVFVEHQSQPDRFMSFRLLEYVCAAFKQHLDNSGRVTGTTFPYPLAIVLHHGKRPWKSVTPMIDLIDAGPGVPRDILKLPVFLIDLAQIPDDQIHGHPAVCALFELLQSASTGSLVERAKGAFRRLRTLRHDRKRDNWVMALLSYYSYIESRAHGMVEGLTDLLMEVYSKQEAKKMGLTIAEALKREGRAEGEASGKAKSILAFLEARFGPVPAKLHKKVIALQEQKQLERAISLSATCESLKDFEKNL